MEKLVITLAMLGNVPTKEMNPSTPITPLEVVDDIQECLQLGVSVAHIHVRDDEGAPTSDRDKFEETQEEIHRRKLDVITQFSTGARGGGAASAEYRGQMLDLKPDMASLSTGSSNFPNSVNANSPELVESLALSMQEHGIKPEIEVFDSAMIGNALRLLKKGVLKAPLHFNLVMGVPGSIPGTMKNLMFLQESLPPGCTWSACGIGAAQVPMLTGAMLLGGHVRTGLEDTILYEKGVLATNKMLVERVVRIAKELKREIASPEEAREILGIK